MMARIEIKRRQYVRAGRRSADDLTDGEWAPIAAGRTSPLKRMGDGKPRSSNDLAPPKDWR
jgi:hypothetical protein